MELSSSSIKRSLYFLMFQETEALKKSSYIWGNRNPKKFLYFLKRKFFLYFQKWNSTLLSSILKKWKEHPPPKRFLIFQEMELSSSNIKKFKETKTWKKLIFILGNGTFQSTWENFPRIRKSQKKSLCFRENLIFLYFRK